MCTCWYRCECVLCAFRYMYVCFVCMWVHVCVLVFCADVGTCMCMCACVRVCMFVCDYVFVCEGVTGVLGLKSPLVRMSPCMLFGHNGHNNTIQVYSVTVMTHVIALDAGQSIQGTFEPITPVCYP